jgi:Ni/Co efflux regulator RcnB
MLRHAVIAATMLAVAAPAAPALSQSGRAEREYRKEVRKADKNYRKAVKRDWRQYRQYDHNRYEPGYNSYYADRYYRSGEYYPTRRMGVNDRIYRGQNGRYYCRRTDGTTGLIVGGVTGGLLGRWIAPGGSRTIGAIVGAAGGALAGRAIDRNNVRCD